MAVHIEHMTSTVDVTGGGAGMPSPEALRQIVDAVVAELASRQSRAERAARDRAVAGGDGGRHGACGCGR